MHRKEKHMRLAAQAKMGYYPTPESVTPIIAKHIQRQIESLSANGGFVFQQVHNIQANVPPENIVTMLEAVNKTHTTKTCV